MGAEIQLFFLDSLLDTNSVENVLLRPIFDSNKAESELDILALEHSFGICSLVHDVDLGDYTDGSDALWIEFPGHLQAIRSSHICIGWQHAEDDCSVVTAVPGCHVFGYFLDVFVLAVDRNTSDSWQIDHCEIWTGVRVNVEHDRFIDDVLFLTTDLVCQEVDGILDFLKVCELLIWDFLKLGPRLDQF